MSDLFNNPLINAAREALTPEQIEHYKQIGEVMYKDIDFELNQVVNMPQPMVDALTYVSEGLKSGLHPSYLDNDEINLLKEGFGDNWFEKFGYTSDDLLPLD
jgi:hypothetical protein